MIFGKSKIIQMVENLVIDGNVADQRYSLSYKELHQCNPDHSVIGENRTLRHTTLSTSLHCPCARVFNMKHTHILIFLIAERVTKR